MHDFRCRNTEDMYYPLLKEKVRYYKEDDKGEIIMNDLFEKYLQEERAEGRAEGKGEMIVNMLKEHMHLDAIERFSGWSAEQIRALAQKNGLAVE